MKQALFKIFLVLMMVFCVSPAVHGEDQNEINKANTYSYENTAYVGLGGTITVAGQALDGYNTFFTVDNSNISISQNGTNVLVSGNALGESTITQTLYKNVTDYADANDYYLPDGEYFQISHYDVTLNPNESFQIFANRQATFTSEDPTIATVDENGVITTHAPGNTSITVTYGDETRSCDVTCGNGVTTNQIPVKITQPSIAPVVYGRVNEVADLTIENGSSQYYIYCANPHVSTANGYITSSKVVDTQLTIYTEGLVLHTRLIMSSAKLTSYENTVLKKGMSKKFVTSGAPHFLLSQMKNTSNRYFNFKNNTIKAKKATGKITLTFNDGVSDSDTLFDNYYYSDTAREFWCVDQKTYNVIKGAYAVGRTKPHYSQKKRTSKKYTDCSTFAWRSYKKAGLALGNKKYAPTAAEDARWLKKHYLLMKGTTKNMNKLRPGDLIFYSAGKNHRFMNIYHIAVYVSNGLVIETVGGYSPDMGCIGLDAIGSPSAIGRMIGVKYRK